MCLEDWVNLNGLQNSKEEKKASLKSILKSSDQVVISIHMVVTYIYIKWPSAKFGSSTHG